MIDVCFLGMFQNQVRATFVSLPSGIQPDPMEMAYTDGDDDGLMVLRSIDGDDDGLIVP